MFEQLKEKKKKGKIKNRQENRKIRNPMNHERNAIPYV